MDLGARVYIDVIHFLLACCTLVALLSGVMVLIWLHDRAAVWLNWISALLVFGSVSLMLLMLDGALPRLVAIGVGTGTFVTAFHLIWTAARVAEGRQPIWGPVILAVGGWSIYCAIPGSLDNLLAPVLVHSVFGALGVGAATYELWLGRSDRLVSRGGLLALLGSVTVFFAARMPFVTLMPFPFGALPAELDWVAGFVMALVIAAIILTILCILFAKDRAALELTRFALTDVLTNLPNRRAFSLDVAKVARGHAADGRDYSLVMLDIDHFKSLNDRYGHDFGDQVLARVGPAIKHCLRHDDTFYRLGGEEFCCIMRDTSAADAARLADGMRFAFRAGVQNLRDHLTVTISAGVASSALAGHDPAAIQAMADAALYRAKRTGRDRVAVGGESPMPDLDVEWAAA
jgi:diguanylate cyclase (GGDEF)-like protein